MNPTFRTTLMQLNADLTAVTGEGENAELGQLEVAEICRLAEKLLQVAPTAPDGAEPGIVVRQGERGWRIAAHQGRLRMHHSTSPMDDYWRAAAPAELAGLPPFQHHVAAPRPAPGGRSGPKGALRTAAEVGSLLVLSVALIGAGVWFGRPRKRLGDLPADVRLVSATDERQTVFASVAGAYATGRQPGDTIVVITPQGRVTLSAIGRDGQPSPPRLEETARAGLRAGVPVVVTSFGVIAAVPPDTVKVNRFKYVRRDPAS